MTGTLVKSIAIDLVVRRAAEAKAALDGIDGRAEELKRNFPEFTAKINTAAASEKLKVFRVQLADATKDRTATVKVKVDDSALQKFADKMKKGGGPSFLGPALLLAPAAGAIGGVAAGAGIGLAGAVTAGAGALAAFGAVAKPVLADALKASQAVGKAQGAYDAAIKAGVPTAQAQAALQAANARAQLSYNTALKGGANPAQALAAYHQALARNQLAYNSATSAGTYNAKAYQAEQKAIGKAYADMSPQQVALSKQLGAMSRGWQDLKVAETPVVAGAVVPWLHAVTDLTGKLGPVISHVSPVIHDLGARFDELIRSSSFTQFRDFIASTGSASVSAGGSALTGFFKGFMILLPQFDPLIREAVGWISRLGPAFVTWASSQKTADRIQAFMQWFSKNGPVVGGLLRNVAGALKALAPGLAAGATEELKVISGFFGFIAKLPPGLAKPLGEVAGTLLILNKLGVFSVGVKLIGMDAAKAAAGGGAVGAWGKLLPGVRLLGGALVAAVVVDMILKSTSSGAGKNWFDNPFGQGTFTDPKSGKKAGTPTALTSWIQLGHDIEHDWDMTWNNTVARTARGFHDVAGRFDQGRHDVAALWHWLGNYVVGSLDQTRHQVAHIADNLAAYLTGSFSKSRAQVAHIWDLTWNNTVGRAQRGFHDVAGWFDTGRHWVAATTDRTRQDIANWWNISWGNTIGRAARGFHDLAGWFNIGRHNVASTWDTVRRDTARIWDTIWNNTVGRAQRGVGDLGRAFSRIGGVVRGPVAAVVDHVLDPLFGFIDSVTNFVGLGKPLPQLHLAGGGKLPGYGGGDRHMALLESGEAVVDKDRTRRFAPLLKAMGVPGMSSGGFVNPVGLNLRPERVDMGVDYGGAGPLFALGSGTITSLSNRGWPGGGFVGLHLDKTPPGGVPWWYYAENVSPYRIGVGSHVSAGQYIAEATGGRYGIEVGYAAPPGTGNTMAAATGESKLGSSHGDPGAYPTGWGAAASRLIASLGGRPGVMSGQLIQGGTPGISGGFAGIIRTLADIFGGLGSMARIAIDLAHGDTGGAGRALLGMVHPSAGGGVGGLGRMLLGLPGVLVKDVVKFLVSGVKGFASAQQAGSVGPGGAGSGALGGDAAANKALARKMFPWPAAMWPSYDYLEMREAGYNRFARNSSSGAYGMPQALPPTKMPFAAQAAGGSHAGPQLFWMFGDISSVYGNPVNAAAHERAFNWYDTGYGVLPPGLSLSYNGTGHPEPLMPARPGRGGGSNNYTINIHVPPNANMAEVGRVTVAAIQQYEKRSGDGWRK